MTDPTMLESGCDCGRVRYRLHGAPLVVHACHCRWCQRETGSAFALNAMIERDRLPPDIHIFTSTKQPWLVLPPQARAVPEYYDAAEVWRPESLERRRALKPHIDAWRAAGRPWD